MLMNELRILIQLISLRKAGFYISLFISLGILEAWLSIELGKILQAIWRGETSNYDYKDALFVLFCIPGVSILSAFLGSFVMGYYTSILPHRLIALMKLTDFINDDTRTEKFKVIFYDTEKVSQWFINPIFQLAMRLNFLLYIVLYFANELIFAFFLNKTLIIFSVFLVILLILSFFGAHFFSKLLVASNDKRFVFLDSLISNSFAMKILRKDYKLLEVDIRNIAKAIKWSNTFANFFVQLPRLVIELSMMVFLVWVLSNSSSFDTASLLVYFPVVLRVLPHIQRIFVIFGQISSGLASLRRVLVLINGG